MVAIIVAYRRVERNDVYQLDEQMIQSNEQIFPKCEHLIYLFIVVLSDFREPC